MIPPTQHGEGEAAPRTAAPSGPSVAGISPWFFMSCPDTPFHAACG